MQRRVSSDLMQASARGNLTAVQRLLAQGSRPDQKDGKGWTVLHHAVGYGQLAGYDVPTGRQPVKAVVEALLKAGALLDARTKEGLTPLMQAVAAQHEDAARWLLDAGADLRPMDKFGGTALTRALWYEHCSRDFARLLIQRGSPINLWDALWLGDTPQALTLAEKVNIRQSGPNGYTYLHLAAELGNLAVAERLLTRGASVNAHDKDGYTPLHHAIGGFPGQVIPAGRPYWHAYGPTTGREPLFKLLLKAGARRDARAEEYTPLACAILAQRPELVRVLLEARANPNGKGRYDEPTLFFAIKTGSPEVVKVLLDAGADPRKKSPYGTSPLERAESRKDPQILALVKAALEKSPSKKR